MTDLFTRGVQAGIKLERERILALIESKGEWHYEFSDVSDVVKLIRGEQ